MNGFSQTLIAAAAGGALGASLRWSFVALGIGGAVGIFLLNVLGSLLLGLVVALFAERAPLLTVFLGAGVLGGLTTFSTFAGDAFRLLLSQPLIAFVYVLASVVFAVLAFAVGTFLGKALL